MLACSPTFGHSVEKKMEQKSAIKFLIKNPLVVVKKSFESLSFSIPYTGKGNTYIEAKYERQTNVRADERILISVN